MRATWETHSMSIFRSSGSLQHTTHDSECVWTELFSIIVAFSLMLSHCHRFTSSILSQNWAHLICNFVRDKFVCVCDQRKAFTHFPVHLTRSNSQITCQPASQHHRLHTHSIQHAISKCRSVTRSNYVRLVGLRLLKKNVVCLSLTKKKWKLTESRKKRERKNNQCMHVARQSKLKWSFVYRLSLTRSYDMSETLFRFRFIGIWLWECVVHEYRWQNEFSIHFHLMCCGTMPIIHRPENMFSTSICSIPC